MQPTQEKRRYVNHIVVSFFPLIVQDFCNQCSPALEDQLEQGDLRRVHPLALGYVRLALFLHMGKRQLGCVHDGNPPGTEPQAARS